MLEGGIGLQSAFIGVFLILFMMLLRRQHEQKFLARLLIKKQDKEGTREMKELAKRFLEKECSFETFNGNQYKGTVRAVSDSGVLLERSGKMEIVNLDLIVRIRECAKNK